MRPTRIPFALLIALAALVTLPRVFAAPSPTLAGADRAYREKSYATAANAYARLLNAGAVPTARKDDVEYRVVVALGKAKKWDQAVTAGVDFIRRHRGTPWEPTGLYWLGRVYLGSPEYSWRLGDRVFRSVNMPAPSETAQPEQFYSEPLNAGNALMALESARVLWDREGAGLNGRVGEGANGRGGAAGIQLNFDLARLIERSYLGEWAANWTWAQGNAADWEVPEQAAYSPDWPPPKKIRFLYRQIALLGENAPGQRHAAALGRFGEALWLAGYQQTMRGYLDQREFPAGASKWFPYKDVQPAAILRDALREFPGDPVTGQARYALGRLLENEGDYRGAVVEYQRLAALEPKCPWAANARVAAAGIRRPVLHVTARAPRPAGEAPRLFLQTRNLKRVRMTAYRISMERVLTRRYDPNEPLLPRIDILGEKSRLFPRARVAQWDVDMPDHGDFRRQQREIAAPLKVSGAYVVEATVPGVRAASLVLVSNLILSVRQHTRGVLCFAADARTGKSLAGARVLLRRRWWTGGSYRIDKVHGTTGAEGLLTLPMPPGNPYGSFSGSLLAVRGDDYAAVEEIWGNSGYWQPARGSGVYGFTDRSVYRPGQAVNSRQILVDRTPAGDLRPMAGRKVTIRVTNPEGRIFIKQEATTSRFGTLHGQWPLPEESPLGQYAVLVGVPNEQDLNVWHDGGSFRVEEYRKPEVEVQVAPPLERVRPGEQAKMKVRAAYYFGGAVPGARVKWTVTSSPYWRPASFSSPFDDLYGLQHGIPWSRYTGPVVARGEAQTDAQGEASIPFSTRATSDDNMAADGVRYTLNATVQDSSRRVVTGSGTVIVAPQDLGLALHTARGYATQGDRVETEIAATNLQGEPRSVQGQARVFLQAEREGGPERLVHEEPQTTGVDGRARLQWTASSAGRYRIAFVTGEGQDKVEGEQFLWAQGTNLSRAGSAPAGRPRFREVFLEVQQPTQQVGRTARVLLVTPVPGCTVLLLREAGSVLRDKRLVRVAGRSLELPVSISRADAPNVFLTAVMVRDGEVFQATRELRVPPVRQMATIDVSADREQYQPGEKARLEIRARDNAGRPLEAEVSVGVSDASLAYIQADTTPDIRRFFLANPRPQPGDMQNGLEVILPSNTWDRLPPPGLARDWRLPSGMGMLPAWPGLGGTAMEDEGIFDASTPAGGFDPDGKEGETGIRYGWKSRMTASTDALLDSSTRAGRRLSREYAGFGGAMGGGMAGGPGYVMAGKSVADADPRFKQAARDSGEGVSVEVRSEFLDTAFWAPSIVTGADGKATVEFSWPDNLTRWRAVTIGTTVRAQVGQAEATVRTKKDLIVRLQAPRFCVERDRVTVSATVANDTDRAVQTRVELVVGGNAGVGPIVCGPSSVAGPELTTHNPQPTTIPAQGEQRVDWTLEIRKAGTLRLRATATAGSLSDAMEVSLPVRPHGIERVLTRSGVLQGKDSEQIAIRLPAERQLGSAEVVVEVAPSLAATALDALPYLADYPYGCVEQTLSRFLPAVIVLRALRDSGADLEALAKRTEGPQPPGQSRPVLRRGEVTRMVAAGLARLERAQGRDGGWGWWPAHSSDPYMSAYVLYGLQLAKQSGVKIDNETLFRASNFMSRRFSGEKDLHTQVMMARVLSMEPTARAEIHGRVVGPLNASRERLTPYGKALLALALQAVGEGPKAQVVLKNLESEAVVDEASGAASYPEGEGRWWDWQHNRVETASAVLEACVAVQPQSPLAGQLVRWLVNNRQGSAWSSTRESALAVLALMAYAKAHRELTPDCTASMTLAPLPGGGGAPFTRQARLTRDSVLEGGTSWAVPDELLGGDQTVTLRRAGPGPLYYTVTTRYFSREEPISAAGDELTVQRRYFRVKPEAMKGMEETKATTAAADNIFLAGRYEELDRDTGPDAEPTEKTVRELLKEGDVLESGDLIEVQLELEAKNDYSYLLFEDMKPAGCEPVDLKSGPRWEKGLNAQMELRDEHVAFFISNLAQGRHVLTYRMWAETPGQFHVLPTDSSAMYAPRLRAISAEQRLNIRDR